MRKSLLIMFLLFAAGITLMGVGIGFVGSFFTVRKHLKV